jgi:hypothetical protein
MDGLNCHPIQSLYIFHIIFFYYYSFSAGVILSTWTIRHSYYGFLFTYGLMFGLGQGIAVKKLRKLYQSKKIIYIIYLKYVIAVSCVINWAPQMVGLGSGIVAAGFGISSSIFAPIQVKMATHWD